MAPGDKMVIIVSLDLIITPTLRYVGNPIGEMAKMAAELP